LHAYSSHPDLSALLILAAAMIKGSTKKQSLQYAGFVVA